MISDVMGEGGSAKSDFISLSLIKYLIKHLMREEGRSKKAKNI